MRNSCPFINHYPIAMCFLSVQQTEDKAGDYAIGVHQTRYKNDTSADRLLKSRVSRLGGSADATRITPLTGKNTAHRSIDCNATAS